MSEENALAMIVAMANKRVIGNDGGLPWHISEDLKHFRKTTTGHAIIMGRKTYESIGKPLPKRRNIVVTRQQDAAFEGCEVAHSLADAIEVARQTDDLPFIIGGASLFEEALPDTTMLFLTDIDMDVEGDTFFPEYDESKFEEVERHDGETKGVVFCTLKRLATDAV